ncbi:MAG: N-acetyltransferase family protein [Acidithiobacillus sp.]
MSFSIRRAVEGDAESLLRHRQVLTAETPFMLYEPSELTKTPDDERLRISRLNGRSNSLLLVAEDGLSIVGNLTAVGGEVRRLRHVATLSLGVLRSHWGQGVGRGLLQHVVQWAESAQLHRLELTVHTANLRALSLYLQAGFQVEGVRRDSICVEGRYVDEYLMSRLSAA